MLDITLATLSIIAGGWAVFELTNIRKQYSKRWLFISVAIYAGIVLIAYLAFDQPYRPTVTGFVFNILIIALSRWYSKKREKRIQLNQLFL